MKENWEKPMSIFPQFTLINLSCQSRLLLSIIARLSRTHFSLPSLDRFGTHDTRWTLVLTMRLLPLGPIYAPCSHTLSPLCNSYLWKLLGDLITLLSHFNFFVLGRWIEISMCLLVFIKLLTDSYRVYNSFEIYSMIASICFVFVNSLGSAFILAITEIPVNINKLNI
jgi:hypothetical protein